MVVVYLQGMSLLRENPVASFQLPKLASTERRTIERRDRWVVARPALKPVLIFGQSLHSKAMDEEVFF